MKLHQVVAIIGDKKNLAKTEVTKAHHKIQRAELTDGFIRTYTPRNEDGDVLPSEKKNVQYTTDAALDDIAKYLIDLFDMVATQERGNTRATANIEVNGVVLLADVPVTLLMFLQKQLVDLQTFIEKLPVLDPAHDWTYDPNAGCYRAEPAQTVRNKKVPRVLVLAEATKEHPAQTQAYQEDVPEGTWTTIKFSGAIPADERTAALDRVRRLRDAVTLAREEANRAEVQVEHIGTTILNYLLKNDIG